MRSRRRSAGIAVALCTALLSTTAFAMAASAEEPLRPTSVTEKVALLTEQAEEERERLARRYPFLQMPDMTPMRVVPDDEWPGRMVQCLRQFGVDAELRGNRVVAPDLDVRTLPGDVVSQTCQLRFPKESSLRYVLGTFELRQLWGYYVFELQSCLRGMGVRVGRAPSFGEYLATRGTDEAWHPYRAIPRIVSIRDLEYYDQICPRFPEWLRA